MFRGQGCRFERTASGEPISSLPSPQAPGLGAASPSPGSQYACFQLSLCPGGRRGVLRGCIEEAGLLHRARVFAQISPLTGPRVGLCYPRYTRYTSGCFPAPGRQVRAGQGAGRGVEWRWRLQRGRKRDARAVQGSLWISIQCPPRRAMRAPSAASGWELASLQLGLIKGGFLHYRERQIYRQTDTLASSSNEKHPYILTSSSSSII